MVPFLPAVWEFAEQEKKKNHLREMVYFGIPYEIENTKEDKRFEFGRKQRLQNM